MIECPNCKAQLPDWAKNCQFCQADTTQVLRPKQQTPNANTFEVPAWIWTAYYTVAGLITADALSNIGVTLSHSKKDGVDFIGAIVIAFNGFSALMGIGLLLRIRAIRAVVNFLCFLGILDGLFGLATGLFGTLLSAWALIWVVLNIVQICINGFMIYLIGETDKVVY